MNDTKKKLFGLFRSSSTTGKKSRDPLQDPDRTNQSSDRPPASQSPRNRPEQSNTPLQGSRSKGRLHTATPSLPLSSWPPPGIRDVKLSQGQAMELIAAGAPVFKGHHFHIPHASSDYHRFYTTAEGNASTGTDGRDPFTPAFAAGSFRLKAPGPADYPWESLEQPSMAFAVGARPGTCTLNHWASLSGRPNPPIELREPNVIPRAISLEKILERLIFLEDGGFNEGDEGRLHRILYGTLLEDPDRKSSPRRGMERQIADLITVLSRPEWVDFSKPENHVAAKFFAKGACENTRRYKRFFHQLLLIMELDLRISSESHAEWAKERLSKMLLPRISWALVLGRKWRACMSIEKFAAGEVLEEIKFHLLVKKAQVKALRRFARAIKWPNLGRVDGILKERSPDAQPLESRSSDSMSYFSGVIFPGPTLPFLVMNSLIDCDEDPTAKSLAALTHMQPNCGFQYKSHTYWSSTSIVGKVLAPTCNEICSWVGPARPAPDLAPAQIARIRQLPCKQEVSLSDINSMTVRSDPLGPPSDTYLISEYELPLPSTLLPPDTIRIEKLALTPVTSIPAGRQPSYDATIQFAIDGRSWPLSLAYDVSFISAWPCAYGPHPLFFDYVHDIVDADEVLGIRDWAGAHSGGGESVEARAPSSSSRDEDDIKERVLVVEAFGVNDREVLVRAWCSHWSLSAVVAEVGKTCMGCAIREAYAACVNVVIMVERKVAMAED